MDSGMVDHAKQASLIPRSSGLGLKIRSRESMSYTLAFGKLSLTFPIFGRHKRPTNWEYLVGSTAGYRASYPKGHSESKLEREALSI